METRRIDLAEIRARCERATARDAGRELIYRRYDHGGGRAWTEDGSEQGDRDLILDCYDEANREFYFWTRTDIPALLAHIEALEGVVREYGLRHHTGCNSFHSWYPGGEGIQELQRGKCDCGLTSRLSELGLEK